MKSSFLIFFSLVFVLLNNVNDVSAQNLVGVSPGDIRFFDVLRGGYAERPLLISLDSEEDVKMEVEAWGNIKDWINFSETEYYVSKENSWRLKVMINPPRDVPNGNYTGFVRVKSDALSKESRTNHAVGAVQAVIDALVTVEVSDREIKSCRASNFRVFSVESGDDIEFSVDVLNIGNIRLKPEFTITIWDQDQINIVEQSEFTGREILPTTTQEIVLKMRSNDLDINQYWVEFSADDCFDSDTLTFDILEEGALRADGIITSIVSKTWADVLETVPIEVSFKNIGQKEVDAQFRGKIMFGDRVVNVLESQTQSVSIDDSTNFTFYYTPREAGKYIVSGRVFYDKKRTFESSVIINVKPKNFTLNTLLMYFVYLALFSLVLYFFYRIRKERIVYTQKIRRLRSI